MSKLAEEQEVERLFGLSPEEFVAARTEAARRLRREGDAEAAARVAALRRPPLSAWAVNQLARARERELQGLLEAGARLRDAQEAALAGEGAAALRDATRTEREAVSGLVEAAAGILRSSGHAAADATRDRIAATLHAAASDPAAAELVRGGRLTRDLEPAGFGALDALAASAGGAPPAAARGNGRAVVRRATGSNAADAGQREAGGDRRGEAGAGRGGAAGGRGAASGRRGAARPAGGAGAAPARQGGGGAAAPAAAEAAAKARARRMAAVAARDDARRRARLAADQAVLATRHAERLGRLADQAEREAARARASASSAIEAAASARERASRAARELAEAEDQLAGGR